ncbi:MAG: hypothetical protein PHG63_03695 [Candidatus Dojkabacteria bacterium]|nr:hypothetical protein [Candidatus Dojkabacteria bacterium]
MKIISALPEFFEDISSLQCERLRQLNNVFGYDRYKTDSSLIMKKLTEDFQNPASPKKNLVVIDNNAFIGFAMLLFSGNIGEILSLELKEENKSPQTMSAVLLEIKRLFALAKISRVLIEISENDQFLQNAISTTRYRIPQQSVILEIKF